MKYFFLMLLVLHSFLQSKPCVAQATGKASANVVGVFDGRTPCRDLASQLDEKIATECIKIKWRLILYKDSITTNSGTYELFGFVYKKDRPRLGKWYLIKGTKSNSDAMVYQLEQPGRAPLFLMKADDNILFFLDKEKNLMVGNRDFSYTLNRVKKVF